MKKGIAVITAVFFLTVTGLALAQINDQAKETIGEKAPIKEEQKGTGMMKGKGGMMGKEMMKMMMGMHGMMKMSDMMRKTVVSTSDGGVVIVGVDKITKYDKDLNVVKEVELKTDAEGMQKMMGEMMEKCSMMGKGIGADDKTPAAEAQEHEAHHPQQ